MKQTHKRLTELCNKWKLWAATTNQYEEGWESDFEDWVALMEAAAAMMNQPNVSKHEFENLDLCWKISHETENLIAHSKEHIEECWTNLCMLKGSVHWEVRWQIYETWPSAGSKAESLLVAALEDPNLYCLRRALLSLSRLKPKNAKTLAQRFYTHHDPYIVKAAEELSRCG